MSRTNEMQYRFLSFERSSVNEEDRTVELSFSSEQPVQRYDWWGDSWNEILGHDTGNVDLSRLSDIGVLLFNHNSNMPIGQVQSCELDTANRKCTAKVRFDDDAESEKIFNKVKSGTLRGVSVGYRVGAWEEVKTGSTSSDGRFTGPCSIAKRWTPFEISIVSIPADPTVGVGRSNQEFPDKEMFRKLIREVVSEVIEEGKRNLTPPAEEPKDDVLTLIRQLEIEAASI